MRSVVVGLVAGVVALSAVLLLPPRRTVVTYPPVPPRDTTPAAASPAAASPAAAPAGVPTVRRLMLPVGYASARELVDMRVTLELSGDESPTEALAAWEKATGRAVRVDDSLGRLAFRDGRLTGRPLSGAANDVLEQIVDQLTPAGLDDSAIDWALLPNGTVFIGRYGGREPDPWALFDVRELILADMERSLQLAGGVIALQQRYLQEAPYPANAISWSGTSFLIEDLPTFREAQERLQLAIEEAVHPDTWRANGGSRGHLRIVDGRVIVQNRLDIIAEVELFLAGYLHATDAVPPANPPVAVPAPPR